jgi:hypothetical protein
MARGPRAARRSVLCGLRTFLLDSTTLRNKNILTPQNKYLILGKYLTKIKDKKALKNFVIYKALCQ